MATSVQSTTVTGTSWSDLSPLGQAGIITQGFGALSGAIGSFYSAKSEQNKARSLALNLEHKADMLLFNKRMKESQAEFIGRQANKAFQIQSIKAGNRRSRARASFGARGIQMGVGSTKDAFVSSEILATLDKLTMNSNKVRAMSNKRLEAVDIGIRADMTSLSASNMFQTASSIDPFFSMSSSLLTGASSIIGSLPPSMFLKK
jgi:hypothetical protein